MDGHIDAIYFIEAMNVSMPYRDCKCSFEDMDNTRVNCQYFKLSDISDAEAEMNATQ
jgi:hypothetical protein